jgi:hypothetical protein
VSRERTNTQTHKHANAHTHEKKEITRGKKKRMEKGITGHTQKQVSLSLSLTRQNLRPKFWLAGKAV